VHVPENGVDLALHRVTGKDHLGLEDPLSQQQTQGGVCACSIGLQLVRKAGVSAPTYWPYWYTTSSSVSGNSGEATRFSATSPTPRRSSSVSQ
jgi:hypothetical protein